MTIESIVVARLVVTERLPCGGTVQVFEAVGYRGVSVVCRSDPTGEQWDQTYAFNGEDRPTLGEALAAWREQQGGISDNRAVR